MTAVSIVTVSANACAAIICALLLLGALVSGGMAAKINRYFLMMLVGCVIGSAAELVFPLIERMSGAYVHYMLDSISLIDYLSAFLVFVAFDMYIYSFLSSRGSVNKRPFIFVCVVYFIQIPVLIATGLHHLFNVQGVALFVSYIQVQTTAIIAAISVLFMLVVILSHVKSHGLTKREWISLLLYLVVPGAMLLPEFLIDGLWLSWLGTAVTAFVIFMNIHIEAQLRLKEKELELTESRVAIMLTQIQPHFLYNTLSAIEYFCDRDGAVQASGIVRDFADYLKGNMNSLAQKKPIPFESEFEHTKLYLSIEQLQYEQRLQVETDIQATGFFIPALTLQPIVENAVKHGVSKREHGGRVTISTMESDDSYLVSVTDDGVGFDPLRMSGDQHIGIENVRHRLKSMCGGSLMIQSKIGAGTTAVITIPKEVSQ